MISTTDAQKIKLAIGNNYGNKIADYCKAKNIVNRNGHPFKAQYIRDIINQPHRDNTDVEEAIWEMIEEKARKLKKRKEHLDDLIEMSCDEDLQPQEPIENENPTE